MGVLSEGDSKLFLFLTVDGVVIVCGSNPWGVVDSIVEDDC